MKIVAVKTTGIYCREYCPSRTPKPENVVRFASTSAARAAGFRACKRCRPDGATRAEAAVRTVIAFIDAHLDEKLALADLAACAAMSASHFQRVFTAHVGVSPRMYVATQRSDRWKGQLQRGKTVLDAAHRAGFNDAKQAYAHAEGALGMSPGAYRRGGTGERLVYRVTGTPLGKALIAITDRGIASIAFGEDARALVDDLRAEFPHADIRRDAASTAAPLKVRLDHAFASVKARLSGAAARPLALDVRGSTFERKVWKAIGTVARGSTKSYSEIARQIGEPTAARAVARACARNKIALVIPCHRILRADGTSGG